MYATSPIEATDASCGFRSGNHDLDDYFVRHAFGNDRSGISRAYVLRKLPADDANWPPVLAFYTLSMALVETEHVAPVLRRRLPKYPMPAALIGRLAVDQRVQGHRLGEKVLLDALQRIVDAAEHLGCVGAIVDAKDEAAEHFYSKYDFTTIEPDEWPRRMFLPITTARQAFRG
jgi:GNAT superfamily N-acetyltransferase